MTLRTVVSHCKDVKEGQGVSYGLKYRTAGASTLGLTPMGYADGVPRVATGGPVRVDGVTYPVVGRIAMDQMVIDLGRRGVSSGGTSLLGAEAELFGNGADGGPTADDWAPGRGHQQLRDRDPHPRAPRHYINESETPPMPISRPIS